MHLKKINAGFVIYYDIVHLCAVLFVLLHAFLLLITILYTCALYCLLCYTPFCYLLRYCTLVHCTVCCVTRLFVISLVPNVNGWAINRNENLNESGYLKFRLDVFQGHVYRLNHNHTVDAWMCHIMFYICAVSLDWLPPVLALYSIMCQHCAHNSYNIINIYGIGP